MNRPAIKTNYVHPPIPYRWFDWVAYRDGFEEGLTGWGATEQAAIDDLLDSESENDPEPLEVSNQESE